MHAHMHIWCLFMHGHTLTKILLQYHAVANYVDMHPCHGCHFEWVCMVPCIPMASYTSYTYNRCMHGIAT